MAVCPLRVDSSDVFLHHKTSHREIYDRCQQACPDLDDVILVNERGELTETRIGNLVLEIEGRRLTPFRDSGLLAGTFRDELLSRGEVEERVLVIDDLARASNVFMINSVREWLPVTVAAWDSADPDRVIQTSLSARP